MPPKKKPYPWCHCAHGKIGHTNDGTGACLIEKCKCKKFKLKRPDKKDL